MAAIEEDFPIEKIADLARAESYRREAYRPAYYVHKWWARRLGTVFRTILLAASLPRGADVYGHYYRPSPNLGGGRILLDPFMGGGVVVGEALRLGYRVVGVDVSPVAWFTVKKMVERVDVARLDEEFARLEERVAPRITEMYATRCPGCGGEARIRYVFWAKEVDCERCGASVRLHTSPVLASGRGEALVSCPRCGHVFRARVAGGTVACPGCGHPVNLHGGRVPRDKYTCPSCGYTGRIVDAVRRMGKPPTHRMVAIEYVCDRCGVGFKAPDGEDVRRYAELAERFRREFDRLLIPRNPIPDGYNTRQILNYGYRYWYELFNERQLLALSTLLGAILEIRDRNVRELFLLLFSAALEYNSMLCSPKGLGTGMVRQAFAHHAYIPPKLALEANVWGAGGSSGGFSTLYRRKLRKAKQWSQHPAERVVARQGTRLVTVSEVGMAGEEVGGRLADSFGDLAAGRADALLLCKPSQRLDEIPDGSVDLVVTDPPYPGNVMYSELAAYFHVWLRLALAGEYPCFARPLPTDPGEIRGDPRGGYDGYREAMRAVFGECRRVLKKSGLLIFTFRHLDPAAWDALADALRGAGFRVVRVYPVYGEMDVAIPIRGKKNTSLNAVLVCRRADSTETEKIPGDVLGAVAGEAEALARRVAENYRLGRNDVLLILLAVWSKHYTWGTAPAPSRVAEVLERLAGSIATSLSPPHR